MRRLALLPLLLVVPLAQATAANVPSDADIRRLVASLVPLVDAYRNCVTQVVADYPLEKEAPKVVAMAAILACQKHDNALYTAAVARSGLPDVSHYMNGQRDLLLDYATALVKARLVVH